MKGEKKNSAFAAGIGYTIGNILIKGVGFLTLPLFSRIMSTAEFGSYNVFLSYESLLFVIIGLALHASIRSANLEFKGKVDSYVSSISLIYLLNLIIFLVAATLFGDTISTLLALEKPLIYLLVFFSFGTAVMTLYNTRLSLNYDYKKYLAVAIINTVGNIALSLLFIFTLFSNQKDMGRALGASLTITVLALFLLFFLFKKSKPKINLQYWKFGLKYSLPVVPHGISQMLLSQFDRIMIRNMVSDAAAGIYSLATNVKIIFTVITTSIAEVWNTWAFKELDQKNHSAIRQRATQLATFFSILTVGLMAISPELIYILGGNEYNLAKYVAIPVVIDGFILFIYELVSSGEYYMKKTTYIMYGTIAAAILNIILNYVFISEYGFIAAAYTTLFSYICYLIFHLFISRKLLGFFIVPIKWLVVFCSIVVVAAAIDLLFVENIFVRWGICALIVIPMAVIFIRKYGIDNIKLLLVKKR